MLLQLDIEDWMNESAYPVLDVRSPSEYNHGHIPGAISFPLFSDEERAQIGTTYNLIGKHEALMQALDFVSPRMTQLVNQARTVASDGKLRIHCWRGGMRSGSVAWLLNTMGFEQVHVLNKGYKAYRQWVLNQLTLSYPLMILGGKTGSAKTEVLKILSGHNETVIDLEKLAHHKGSAFGWIGESDQPSQEQFENDLTTALGEQNNNQGTWLEDESERIGLLRIPTVFFNSMRVAPLYFLDIPKPIRIHHLIHAYAHHGDEKLELSILRITKKLGGANTKMALQALRNKDYEQVADLVLYYYDKSYDTGLNTRNTNQVIRIISETIDPEINAQLILHHKSRHRHGTHQTHSV